MKTLSAGVVIVRNGQVLLGHSTNNEHWDIFKGKVESGETPIQAAIRELKEESGIDLLPEQLVDLGKFSYNKKKNLHLFLHTDAVGFVAENCHCDAKVEDKYPEMDDYKWVDFCDTPNYCVPAMCKVLLQILG